MKLHCFGTNKYDQASNECKLCLHRFGCAVVQGKDVHVPIRGFVTRSILAGEFTRPFLRSLLADNYGLDIDATRRWISKTAKTMESAYAVTLGTVHRPYSAKPLSMPQHPLLVDTASAELLSYASQWLYGSKRAVFVGVGSLPAAVWTQANFPKMEVHVYDPSYIGKLARSACSSMVSRPTGRVPDRRSLSDFAGAQAEHLKAFVVNYRKTNPLELLCLLTRASIGLDPYVQTARNFHPRYWDDLMTEAKIIIGQIDPSGALRNIHWSTHEMEWPRRVGVVYADDRMGLGPHAILPNAWFRLANLVGPKSRMYARSVQRILRNRSPQIYLCRVPAGTSFDLQKAFNAVEKRFRFFDAVHYPHTGYTEGLAIGYDVGMRRRGSAEG